jgi:putative ABC transport system permease protein
MLNKKAPDWSAYVRENLQLRGFRPERETEIVEEIAQQLDEAYQEALRAGGSEQEARAAAEEHVADWAVLRQQLAGSQREKEFRAAIAPGQGQERDLPQSGRFSPRTEIRQDLLYALRVFRKNLGFTAIAVLSLALGTGANTAIFQLIDSLRLRTLPVSNPQQLAAVRILDTSWRYGRIHGRYPDVTNAQWEQIRDHQRVFSNMLAWATEGGFNLAPSGEARYASGIWVSGDFFKTLEVPALRGRTLTAEDDRRGCGSPPAVISYSFWQREYGGGPDAVGRMISLDGHSFEIVGITPPSFTGIDVGRQFDVAVPLCSEPLMHGESALMDLLLARRRGASEARRDDRASQRGNGRTFERYPGSDRAPAIRCGGAKALPAVQVRSISGSYGILESAEELRDTSVDAVGHRRPSLADCLRQYRQFAAGACQRPWT